MRLLNRNKGPQDLNDALEQLTHVVELGEELLDEADLAPARALLEQAAQRRELSPHITVAALAGATGAGKSTLANALVGAQVARSAVTRPTTVQPLAVVPTGAETGELLDWLEVDQRIELPGGAQCGKNTVLLDLPDIDSDVTRHREIATRMARKVDVLIWVLDPEKYADGVVHRDFLAPMATHSSITLVVLNQIDRLSEREQQTVLADLRGLLAREGLQKVAVLPASALTGQGIAELRAQIARVAEQHNAAEERLAADVRSVARNLNSTIFPESTGKELLTVNEGIDAADQRKLEKAAYRAAGIDTVCEAVGSSMRRKAGQKVGWLPIRWVGRFRRDPLRQLHLASAPRQVADDDVELSSVVALSSMPAVSPIDTGILRTANHSLTAQAVQTLPFQWANDCLERSEERARQLPDLLDRTIACIDLEQGKTPWWWSLANLLQWLCFLTAVTGGLWLAGAAAAKHWLLLDLGVPYYREIPIPTLMVIGGIALGILLALLGLLFARIGAAMRARRCRSRLQAASDEIVETHLLEPLETELETWDELRQSLQILTV